MASAQVLPSTRKQEHLEAGKRRLEEFRKKKAAERAKKAASTNPNIESGVSVELKKQSESELVRFVDSDGAITSGGHGTSVVLNNKSSNNNNNIDDDNLKAVSLTHGSPQPQVSSHEIHANAHFPEGNHISYPGEVQIPQKVQETRNHYSSGNGPLNAYVNPNTRDFSNDLKTYTNAQDTLLHEHVTDQSHQESQDSNSYPSLSSFNGKEDSEPHEGQISFETYTAVKPFSSQEFFTRISSQSLPKSERHTSNGSLQSSHHNYSSLYEDSLRLTPSTGHSADEEGTSFRGHAELSKPIISDIGKRTKDSSANVFPHVQSSPMQSSESSPFSFDLRSSSSHVPLDTFINESRSRRARPSFLDSLHMPKAASASIVEHNEMGNTSISKSALYNGSIFQKTPTETETLETLSKSTTPDISSANRHNSSMSGDDGVHLSKLSGNQDSVNEMHQLYSIKQNEDFAALEQHIEDLTQEKFSLQRALEASRSLAESLAAENSSLTDNYNQQRGVVNQLKSDMENLQEEMRAQLAELESFRMEYTNARLECSAADERAGILASEVIGLEEKALKLRSNELKLEKQLENAQDEISSFKKKMSSLEKDRQDLKLTIDALKEEKKVLQSKLWNASAGGKTSETKVTICKKDMWTSTDDLENAVSVSTLNQETYDAPSVLGSEVSNFILPPEVEALSTNIPLDQRRTIENINALLSELAVEKEELMHALSSELSQTSKLKELNKELTKKLEAQTQRLELLTAQSIASENVSSRQAATRTIHDNSAYADEGDEVVERVLGWIMKLFPGGSSKRRISKRVSYPI